LNAIVFLLKHLKDIYSFKKDGKKGTTFCAKKFTGLLSSTPVLSIVAKVFSDGLYKVD